MLHPLLQASPAGLFTNDLHFKFRCDAAAYCLRGEGKRRTALAELEGPQTAKNKNRRKGLYASYQILRLKQLVTDPNLLDSFCLLFTFHHYLRRKLHPDSNVYIFYILLYKIQKQLSVVVFLLEEALHKGFHFRTPSLTFNQASF